MSKTKAELGYTPDGPKCCGNCDNLEYEEPIDNGYPVCALMPVEDNAIVYHGFCNSWKEPDINGI